MIGEFAMDLGDCPNCRRCSLLLRSTRLISGIWSSRISVDGVDVELNWNPAIGAADYQIHLTSTPFGPLSESRRIATVPSPPFTHEGVLAGWTKGFYRILAEY